MKDYPNRYRVVGTSALKSNCSRYSNENERIIDFPGEEVLDSEPIDYGKLVRARHVTATTRMTARCRRTIGKSEIINDVRTGNLRGTGFGGMQYWKMFVAGGIYSIMAIAAIFITSM